MQMTTSIERTSRKGKQPRLSDQLKASDLFPPGVGWNSGAAPQGTTTEAPRPDAMPGQAPLPPRQH
jgi:hypothetical protein